MTELLGDFSSAEILFALMMMAAMSKKDEEGSGGGAALGFLAGLALAGQLGRSGGLELISPIQEIQPNGGGLGGSINVSV